MARIGLKSGKYNFLDYTTNKYKALTDGKVPCLEKIVDEKASVEYNSAELYASDGLAESDYSFKKGTLALTVANDDDKKDAELLGNTYGEDGEVTRNIADTSPEVAYGHIVTKQVNNVKMYKVEFFPRVKFNKITTDGKTRGEGVEFGTTSIEGVILPLETDFNGYKEGDWEKHKTFPTKAEAESYLDACLTPSVN